MKRNQLKDLGLDEDQIKAVMGLNGEDINNAKSGNDAIVEENNALKAQIAERDKDLKNLRKNAKDNEELSNSYKELEAKYKSDTADLTNKLNQTRLTSAVDRALSASKVRDTKAIKGFLDMDKVKLDDQGNLSGLDEQIKEIRQTAPYIFDEGTKQNYEPNNGTPATTDPIQAMVDVFKK
ncbi:phage scaffolding protein [Lactobacillus amylovorus subsp. animalium]|uniref:Phage scaffolding protein n=1 Tax=Lactobacillus amylovorus subsp. animalium TaxID=3378536 RepID=A0ABD0C2X0_LACAM|nr:phage scaffolding protein [Lactobacillus amylovorus]GMM16166.1 phage scaffolding protein [Lactobacillus amylovorus]